MNREIRHFSIEEILHGELTDPKSFEGGKPLPTPALREELIKKMEEYDPGGEKAHEIAKEYQ